LNVKFEDYKQYDRVYDLIFTSIPYFDLEQYSNTVHYDDFNQWKQNFIGEFLNYKNKIVLNLPCEFTALFQDVKEIHYLKHNGGPTSDNSSKIEHIIVI
jgi:DNA modification methylase